jgi:bifunctional aspartokinase / homoserine dehydrogenase 1
MSNHIVRLGGSQAGNAASVNNLITYLGSNSDRKFLIVSALPDILDLIQNAVENVFNTDIQGLSGKLQAFYGEHSASSSGSAYSALVEQVSAIFTGIQLIGDYSGSLKDQLKGFSEKLTAEIFKAQLADAGTASEILWPEHIGLKATDDYGNATFLSVDTKLLNGLAGGFYLIPGSYGITDQGKISRAGNTAADYTAAFLTNALDAGKLELWGIDLPFRRADLQLVADAPQISRLTYSEASELAYFDHFSFHPRTVEPLENRHIPVYVMNTGSENGEVYSTINTETFIESQIVKSVAYTDDVSLLRLNGPGVGLKPGILARVTSRLNEAGINIKSVITSQISINLILGRKTGNQALNLIRQLGFSSVKEISVIDDVSLIGVVGHGMQQNYGVSAKIFGAVAQHKINVVLSGSGASDLVSYLVVKSSDKEKSVREIYNAFFSESNPTEEIINK